MAAAQVLGRVVTPSGDVIGELLDNADSESVGTLVDGSGAVVGGLVATPGARDQVRVGTAGGSCCCFSDAYRNGHPASFEAVVN